MALTEITYTGNGGATFGPIPFPYLEESDVLITINGSATNAFTIDNSTKIFTFSSAPAIGSTIRVYRNTNNDTLAATFVSGSAIRAVDLNDNFTQNLYVIQEIDNNAVQTDGSTPFVGDVDMGGYKITNLAAPVAGTDAANRTFVEGVFSSQIPYFYRRWSKTAVGGETSLSGTDDNGISLSYVAGSEKVFINGALQVRGVDYTGTTGTTLTGIPALTAGDIVEVHSSSNYLVGTIPDGSVTNAKVDGGAAIQSTKLAFTQSGTGATTRTVESKLRDVVSVKDFGAVGDGVTDDTAAIQAAIDLGGYAFDTNTVATEGTAKPITVYIPSGVYRCTSKIRLAPGLQLIGESGGIHARTGGTSVNKKGSTLYFDYEGETDYVLDTSGFNGSGVRQDNVSPNGGAQAGGTLSFASGIRIENLLIEAASGRQLRGLNLGGAPMCVIDNVMLYNFIVAFRLSACWGGSLSNIRIEGSNTWRGLVLGADNNDTALQNVYISGQGTSGYTPPVSSTIGDVYWTGWEGSPALYGGTSRADLERSHGMWTAFSKATSNGLTIESAEVGLGQRDSQNTFNGVYMEAINDVLIADYVSCASKITFCQVTACTNANVISGVDSHTSVILPKISSVQSSLSNKNIRSWSNPSVGTVPVIQGINKGASDTLPNYYDHVYNDGLLITANRETDKTLGGHNVFYNASGLNFDERDVGNVLWRWRGAEKLKLEASLTRPILSLGGTVIQLNTSGGNASFSSSGLVYLKPSGRTYVAQDNAFYSNTDNASSLGRSGERWSVVYAATGTINTSDGREKQDIEDLSDAELRVATALKGLIKKFRFKDAVQLKDDNARIHIGVITQEVIAAFQAEGLDPMRYGIVCYDQWDAEFDDDGNEIKPAGNRYGIRYEELLAFIIAAL